MPENTELFHCFCLCDSQLRAGMGGAYAMDWNVVIRVAEDRGVETDDRFYFQLRNFEHALIEEIGKKGEG